MNGLTQSYIYTYDEDENITSETLRIETTNEQPINKSVIYEYDSHNQLIKATSDTTEWSYVYDGQGNITSKTEKNLSTGEEVTYNYGYDAVWKDKLISYNGQTISYDNSGNPVNYRGNSLTWTMGRQLASFNDIEFTYDENGIRTSKTVDDITTMFYLDGTNIIEQRTGTDVIHFYYDSNDEIVGFKYNSSNYFYVKNLQGDITDIVNASGEVVSSYAYDPWGKVISIIGNTEVGEANPFRYRGYYYDNDVQMYYLQSRYYDAEVGRFINCDDVRFIGYSEQSISYNPFTYCRNNPICFLDPLGHNSMTALLKNVGKTLIYNILLNRLNEIPNLDFLIKRLKSANEKRYSSKNTKFDGLKKYSIAALSNGTSYFSTSYVDYYDFYVGTWSAWDSFLKSVENNSLYKMYNTIAFSVAKVAFQTLFGFYYEIQGIFMSVADLVVDIGVSNLSGFISNSRATLNAYKKNKNTDALFIAIVKITGQTSTNNAMFQQTSSYHTYYNGDTGIEGVVL